MKSKRGPSSWIILWAAIVLPFSSSAWQQPISRRQTLQQVCSWAAAATAIPANADTTDSAVLVQVLGPEDSLGIQISSNPQGQVVIQRVVVPKSKDLKPGMVLQGYSSPKQLLLKLASGPYPVDLEFIENTTSPSQASPILKDSPSVTPSTNSESNAPSPLQFTKRVLQPAPGSCRIQTQKGDVMEIEYEAKYLTPDGRKVLYDASSFRGTGRPYQMVLGSGDMIPGVDQGLQNMCPGEIRRLEIPPPLAYGPRARGTFKIPVDYRGLEWTVELVSIDGTIRADNNDLTRQEREAAY